MNLLLIILSLIFAIAALIAWLRLLRLQKESDTATAEESERLRKHYESEALRIHSESQALITTAQERAETAIKEAREAVAGREAHLRSESERLKEHFESESRKAKEAADSLITKLCAQLDPLRRYEAQLAADSETRTQIQEALEQAVLLKGEAANLLEASREQIKSEHDEIIHRAKATKKEADEVLDAAVRRAAEIVKQAEKKAAEIGKEGYVALRDKEVLEQAVKAIWNVVEGYGDRYIVPTRSLLDELASEFGHTEAGNALKAARDQTRRMVEQGLAADCNYVEQDRRERAIRFVASDD